MILFLDFDGVLHPERRTKVDDLFCRLPLLEDWLRLRPGLDVVISSSWREAHPLDVLIRYFSEDLQSRVVGCTPVFKQDSWQQYDGEPPPVRFPRETEVLRWLSVSFQQYGQRAHPVPQENFCEIMTCPQNPYQPFREVPLG